VGQEDDDGIRKPSHSEENASILEISKHKPITKVGIYAP
jgi:hypothetical protein